MLSKEQPTTVHASVREYCEAPVQAKHPMPDLRESRERELERCSSITGRAEVVWGRDNSLHEIVARGRSRDARPYASARKNARVFAGGPVGIQARNVVRCGRRSSVGVRLENGTNSRQPALDILRKKNALTLIAGMSILETLPERTAHRRNGGVYRIAAIQPQRGSSRTSKHDGKEVRR